MQLLVCQKEVFQVFPMAAGLSMLTQGDKWENTNTTSSPAVGVVYFGRHEVSFKGSVNVSAANSCYVCLVCQLSSFSEANKSQTAETRLHDIADVYGSLSYFYYKHFNVVLNQTGAHFVLQSTDSPLSTGQRSISKTLELPFSGPFPWLLTFGLRLGRETLHSFTFTYPVVALA